MTTRDDILALGLVGGLAVFCAWGSKKLYDAEKEYQAKRKAEEEKREAEKKAFEEKKEAILDEIDKACSIEKLTLGNKNLEPEDAAYMYGKLTAAYARVEFSTKESIDKRLSEFTKMANILKGTKETIGAYVLYLKQQDDKADKAAQEAAIRQSEREKIEAEQNALKLRLDAESKKTDAIVDSIKAIANAGKTESGDVNVVINNKEE